jgi:hypothetical protein
MAKYGTLFDGIDTTSMGKRLYYPLLLVKKVCFITILTTYYEEPLIQTGLISSLNMSYSVYLFTTAPSKTRGDQIKTLSCEILLLFVEFSVFLYAIDDYVNYLSDESRFNVGWFIIGFTGLIVTI